MLGVMSATDMRAPRLGNGLLGDMLVTRRGAHRRGGTARAGGAGEGELGSTIGTRDVSPE